MGNRERAKKKDKKWRGQEKERLTKKEGVLEIRKEKKRDTEKIREKEKVSKEERVRENGGRENGRKQD